MKGGCKNNIFSFISTKKMKHLEEDLQMACVKWFGLQYPKLSLLLHHSPNGGYRNIREAARFKAMGTRAGFPDLILMIPKHGFHALCVEMKTSKGKQSEAQMLYQQEIEKQGYSYRLCRSLDEFISILTEYLSD